MNAALLSNEQLYSLSTNKALRGEVKEVADKELEARGLSVESQYDVRTNRAGKPGIWPIEQLLIIISPLFGILLLQFFGMAKIYAYFALLQVLMSSRHLAGGNVQQINLYWRYVTIGYAAWCLAVLLSARYIVGP